MKITLHVPVEVAPVGDDPLPPRDDVAESVLEAIDTALVRTEMAGFAHPLANDVSLHVAEITVSHDDPAAGAAQSPPMPFAVLTAPPTPDEFGRLLDADNRIRVVIPVPVDLLLKGSDRLGAYADACILPKGYAGELVDMAYKVVGVNPDRHAENLVAGLLYIEVDALFDGGTADEPTYEDDILCALCGHPMMINTDGTPHHIASGRPTDIDYERDADHMPYSDEDDGLW